MSDLRWLSIISVLLLGFSQELRAGTGSPDSARLEAVEIGLGGQFKVGYWTPVRLTVSGGPGGFLGNVAFTLPDGDGVPTRYLEGGDEALRVPKNESWTGWRYVKLGRLHGRIRVVLQSLDGHVTDSLVANQSDVHATTDFWVVGTGADIGVSQSFGFLVRAQAAALMSSQLTRADQFPDRWYGYEGVDVMLVPLGEANPIEQLDDHQFAAFRRWLQSGGRVVFSAGRRAAELFSAEKRFSLFRPGEFQDLATRWSASGLEHYAGAGQQLFNPDGAPLANFSQLRGRVICLEGAGGGRDRALVTRYPFGLGQITYLAIDLDKPPVSTWQSRPRLLARLLQDEKHQIDTAGANEGLGQVTHIGFNDFIGQLRGALDQFTGVVQVRFSWIAGILVLYVVLLGPVDFFGLHKLGRYRWTWVTFPLIVISFCILAVLLSHRWKGGEPKVNQVDIVDIDVEQSLVRGTTWANFYSPYATAMELALQPTGTFLPSATPAGQLMSWQGLPGEGLGGMSTKASVGELSGAYTVSGNANPATDQQLSMAGFPVHTSSTKGIISRWWMHTEPLNAGQVTAQDRELLVGRIANPLDISLSHCAVLYENWFYRLDRRLDPGEAVDLEFESPLDLRWQLTRRRLLETTDVSTPWNQADFDNVPRILEMLMFHDAAGGRNYTRLSHRYQTFIDLSPLLRTGRAILMGRSKQTATAISRDGKVLLDDDYDQHWTYYRILIPVQTKQ